MAQLNVRREYADLEILLESDLDAFLDDIETFLNTTKLDDDNLQDSGISGTKLKPATVTIDKMAAGSVGTTQLVDDSVTAAKLNADTAGTAIEQNAGTGALDLSYDDQVLDVISYSSFDFVDGDVTTGTDEITEVAHGLITGVKVQLTTTGTLPAGLATSTDYYVIKVDDDTIQLASSYANATGNPPVPVDITGAIGGGTHSVNPQDNGDITVKTGGIIKSMLGPSAISRMQTKVFSANDTWEIPADVYEIFIFAYGGGGGGGAGAWAGGGGDGGQGCQPSLINTACSPGNAVTITIGSGGAGGTGVVNGNGGAGSAGGATIVTIDANSYSFNGAAGGAGGTTGQVSVGSGTVTAYAGRGSLNGGGGGGTLSGGASQSGQPSFRSVGGSGGAGTSPFYGGGGGGGAGASNGGNGGAGKQFSGTGNPGADGTLANGGSGGGGGGGANNVGGFAGGAGGAGSDGLVKFMWVGEADT